jgi:hypothetical protein
MTHPTRPKKQDHRVPGRQKPAQIDFDFPLLPFFSQVTHSPLSACQTGGRHALLPGADARPRAEQGGGRSIPIEKNHSRIVTTFSYSLGEFDSFFFFFFFSLVSFLFLFAIPPWLLLSVSLNSDMHTLGHVHVK